MGEGEGVGKGKVVGVGVGEKEHKTSDGWIDREKKRVSERKTKEKEGQHIGDVFVSSIFLSSLFQLTSFVCCIFRNSRFEEFMDGVVVAVESSSVDDQPT